MVAEFNQTGTWLRGYVYDGGGQLLALQAGGVRWVHQDPVTKSQRVTNKWGTTLETIDLDPWGGETTRTQSTGVQPRKYTTYDRDANGRDQAMMRSYHGWFSRFDQPDPSDGSYDLANTQSLNRYAYVSNDPVNFVDPSGLDGVPFVDGGTVTVYGTAISGGGIYFGNSIGGLVGNIVGGSVLDEILTTEILSTDSLGVLGPQNSTTGDNKTDCQRFADAVQEIANNSANYRAFMDQMAKRFTGAQNSGISQMLGGSEQMTPLEFSDDGMRRAYREVDSDGNLIQGGQIRHFVGGLIAGYNGGNGVGRIASTVVMDGREITNAGTTGSFADVALNGLSTRLGANNIIPRRGRTRGPFRGPGSSGYRDLASIIRRELCE